MRNSLAIALACGAFVVGFVVSAGLPRTDLPSMSFIAPVVNHAGTSITLTATFQDAGGRIAHTSKTLAPGASDYVGVYKGEDTQYALSQNVVLAAFSEKAGCVAVSRIDCSKWWSNRSPKPEVEVTDDAIIVREAKATR